MIKAAFCYVFGGETIEADLSRLAEYGFDGVEFWPKTFDCVPVSRLRELLEGNGLACAQVCPYFNFVEGREEWDKSLKIAANYIGIARELGAPLIRVFTGRPWGGPTVGPREATEEQWRAAVEGLQRICDLAAPHGLSLALECHEGNLMEDSPSTLRLLREVGRPNLGVNLQLPLRDEEIRHSIEQLAPYTIHVHAHNWPSVESFGDMTRNTFLEEGAIDYHDFASYLIARGFAGYFSIEHPGHGGKDDPWETARREGAFLRRLKERLSGGEGSTAGS